MNRNLLVIRIFFFLLTTFAGYWVCDQTLQWQSQAWAGAFVGGSAALFVIALDLVLKGVTLRGLSSLALGLFVGWLTAKLLVISPLLSGNGMDSLYLVKIAVYLIFTYLGAIIALKGKDDFHFVVPFVRFVPQDVNVPLAVVDSSALIDGRIVGLCATKFMGYALVVPQFVLDELHRVADSDEPTRRARGRKGLETLNALKKMSFLDLRVSDVEIKQGQTVDDKLIFLAHSLKAKVLTMDYNTARLAEFNGLEWLNINALAKYLHAEVAVGDIFTLTLVKSGKEAHQAVGFLGDGSMVVVDNAREKLGQSVNVEVTTVLPSAGGRMIFGKLA